MLSLFPSPSLSPQGKWGTLASGQKGGLPHCLSHVIEEVGQRKVQPWRRKQGTDSCLWVRFKSFRGQIQPAGHKFDTPGLNISNKRTSLIFSRNPFHSSFTYNNIPTPFLMIQGRSRSHEFAVQTLYSSRLHS